jgi:hypothetical protein
MEIMNAEKYNYLNDIQILFNTEFREFLSVFSDETTSSIDKLEETYSLEIKAINISTCKKITWSFSHYLNFKNDLYNELTISFETFKKEGIKRNSFFLKDYLTYRKIEINLQEWDHHTSYEEEKERLKVIFRNVLVIIQTEELNRILFTNEWLEVPIDMSPYK